MQFGLKKFLVNRKDYTLRNICAMLLRLTYSPQRGRPDSWSDKDQRKTEKDVGIKLNRPTEEVSSHNQTNKCVRDAKFSDKRDGQVL